MEAFMQLTSLPRSILKLADYSRKQLSLEEYRKKFKGLIEAWEALKNKGMKNKDISEILGVSKTTYYRYKDKLNDLNKGIMPKTQVPKKVNQPTWGKDEKDKLYEIIKENPTYGKDKLSILFNEKHNTNWSISTIGRIKDKLKTEKPIPRSLSAIRKKRKRSFKGHAKPYVFKKYELMEIGEYVQIDHMTISKNGITVKHFQAWERNTKFLDAMVTSNATAHAAKRFLLQLIKRAPFKILSIQVDGGSEFMEKFEQACADLKIPLMVLPPRTPQYNGGVERANRTLKEEFYSRNDILVDSIGAIKPVLDKYLYKYNNYRPHASLKGMTPMQYYKSITSEALSQEQLSQNT